MVDTNPTTSIIALNGNGPNIPIQSQSVIVGKKKERDLTISSLLETHFKYKGTEKLKVKG